MGRRVEREAYREDDGARDQGRKELLEALCEDSYDDGDKASDQLCAEDLRQAEAAGYVAHRRKVGKADAHDDRQPCTAYALDAEELEQGREGGAHQR